MSLLYIIQQFDFAFVIVLSSKTKTVRLMYSWQDLKSSLKN